MSAELYVEVRMTRTCKGRNKNGRFVWELTRLRITSLGQALAGVIEITTVNSMSLDLSQVIQTLFLGLLQGGEGVEFSNWEICNRRGRDLLFAL